ncbi:MAG: DNA polymerase III subunit delta [Psychrobacillus sp.]
MKVYLVHGEEQFLLDEYIKGIKPAEAESIEKYDVRDMDMEEIIFNCSQGSLFSFGEKFIILNDVYFLRTEKAPDKSLEALQNFLQSNAEMTVILKCPFKLDKRKKIVKTLLKEAICFEGKPMYNTISWINKRAAMKGLNLTSVAIKKISGSYSDLYMIENELIKYKNYFGQSSIDAAALENIMAPTLENDIFKLIDSVVDRSYKAIEQLGEIILNGNDEIKINLLISRQLRLIEQVLLGNKSIEVHSFVLSKAREQAEAFTVSEVASMQVEVTKLDIAMKRGEVDKANALETMILGWL